MRHIYKLLKIMFRGGVYTLGFLFIIIFAASIIKEFFNIEDVKMVEIVVDNLTWFVGLFTGYQIFEVQEILKRGKLGCGDGIST
jgi:hypothetical protein